MCPIPQLEKLNGVEVIPFAETNYRGVRRKFGIKRRSAPAYVFGRKDRYGKIHGNGKYDH